MTDNEVAIAKVLFDHEYSDAEKVNVLSDLMSTKTGSERAGVIAECCRVLVHDLGMQAAADALYAAMSSPRKKAQTGYESLMKFAGAL